MRDDAIAVAARMITAHAAWQRADGESHIPLYVLDAGYNEASRTALTAGTGPGV